MVKEVVKVASYFVLFVFMLVGYAACRHLTYDAPELVSDGGHDGEVQVEESYLQLKGMDSAEERCELMYGFLPCSTNIPSHIFLIVIYEYLLYHGESYAGGDGRIFRVLGKNFFVSSFSQLLDSLPDSLILLVSGLSASEEKAQEYVVTGAGLLAGSSILLLTLLWGVCFICASKNFHPESSPKVKNQGILLLTGFGVRTDSETSYHANVMFYSLIPFVVVLLPSVFGVSYSSQEYNIVLLASLFVAATCLFSYFCYQYTDGRIQKRRLEYAEVEQKVEMYVPFYEVQALILDREKHLMLKQKEMEKMMKHPKENSQVKMTKEEFYDTFEKWLDGTRQLMDDPSLDKSETDYNQVVELLLEDRNKLIDLISLMMKRATGKELLKEDGTQDESVIDSFFACVDEDKNGSVTPAELKHFIIREDILVDAEIADIITRHLDVDGDGGINISELKAGVKKLLKSRNLHKHSPESNGVNDKYHRAEAKAKSVEKIKAIILLFVGILILMALAEPLVESVRKFSESVDIEPFYVSFILVPLATNARTAMAAILAAKQKRHHTTSLTFSEIYHKVFMNNILGFLVLVSVIYFRGLKWHFSAEILVLIIVCIIMGLLARLRSKFPNWTLFISFPLYPLSLVVVYLVNDAFEFT